MKKLSGVLAFSALLATGASAQIVKDPFHQPAKGVTKAQPWKGEMGIRETVEEIMIRENRHQFGDPRRENWIKEHEPFNDLIRDMGPKELQVSQWPPLPKGAQMRLGGGMYLPQTQGRNWLGDSITPGLRPPDPELAVGPTQVVVTDNNRIRVFDKNGNIGGLDATMNTFFTSVRNGSSISDPQVRYDTLTNRWFVLAINVSSPNRFVLAVSSGSTITNSSSFTFFQFQQDLTTPTGNTGQLADYPSLGIDSNALYTGANMFTSTFQGCSLWVINKASVLGAGPIVVSTFRNVGGTFLTPRGVDCEDSSQSFGYYIADSTTSAVQVPMRKITSPGGTPVMGAEFTVTIPTVQSPSSVTCLGDTTPLDAIDTRFFTARIRKNRISNTYTMWTAHNVRTNSSGVSGAGNRNSMRWYEFQNVATTPTLRQSGTSYDSAASNFDSHWFGTPAMSGQGHMAMGFTIGGTARHAGVGAAGRLRTDTLGTTQAKTVILDSTFVYNGPDTSTQRWGDYGTTAVDPTDDQTMWTAVEYCSAANTWGVRVVELKAPPPATISSLAPNAIQQGQTLNITVNGTSVSGSEFYDTEPGKNRLLAAFSGTGLTVNSVTWNPATPNSPVLNVTASGSAATGTRNITMTNPDLQTSALVNALTVTPGPVALTGTCTLENYVGPVGTYSVTFDIMNGASVVESHTVTLGAGYSYNFTTTLRGNYTVRAKALHWLRKLSAPVNITDSGITGLNFSLKNADINNDNVVDLGDFDQFSAAFGSSTGDGNYNMDADLNLDGAVDLGDFDILAGSFGLEGD